MTVKQGFRTVSLDRVGPVKEIDYHFLSTNGDGTGDTSAIGDYSLAEEIFYHQPAVNEVFRVTRIVIEVGDDGNFDSGSYGNSVTLTNGIVMRRINNGVTRILTKIPITINPHWPRYCFDENPSTYGTGANYMTYRWTYEKSGNPIRLVGATNDRLEIVLNDDFTGLVDQTFCIQGYYE